MVSLSTETGVYTLLILGVVLLAVVFVGVFLPGAKDVINSIDFWNKNNESDKASYSVDILKGAYEKCFDVGFKSDRLECLCDSGINFAFKEDEKYVEIEPESTLFDGKGLKFESNKGVARITDPEKRFCLLVNNNKELCEYEIAITSLTRDKYTFYYQDSQWRVKILKTVLIDSSILDAVSISPEYMYDLYNGLLLKPGEEGYPDKKTVDYDKGVNVMAEFLNSHSEDLGMQVNVIWKNGETFILKNNEIKISKDLLSQVCSGGMSGSFRIDEKNGKYGEGVFKIGSVILLNKVVVKNEPLMLYMVKKEGLLYACLVPQDKLNGLEGC